MWNASPATCATPHRSNARCRAAGCSSTWRPITGCGPRIRANSTAPTWTARGICCDAARDAGVERVVYTSTVGCIGVPAGGIGDETIAGDARRHGGRLQALQVSGRAGGAGIRARGLAGGDCEPHRPGGRSRREAHADGQDRAGFPERRHAGIHRYRAQRGGCARYRRGPLAGLRTRRVGRALHSGLGESDAGADSAEAGGDHRQKGAHHPPSLRGGVLCRRVQHGLGRSYRASRRAYRWTRSAWRKRKCGCPTRRPSANWASARRRPNRRWRAPWSGSAGRVTVLPANPPRR